MPQQNKRPQEPAATADEPSAKAPKSGTVYPPSDRNPHIVPPSVSSTAASLPDRPKDRDRGCRLMQAITAGSAAEQLRLKAAELRRQAAELCANCWINPFPHVC